MAKTTPSIDFARAFWAGVAAAGLISMLTAIGRMAGMPVNLELWLGSMLVGTAGFGTWGIGFAIHLFIGGLFGLLYGYLFDHVLHRVGWSIGLGIGAVHGVLAGLLMGLLPLVHPLMPQSLASPGVFLAEIGPGAVIAFFILHLLFGSLMGAAYAPVAHAPRRELSLRP